MRVLNALLKHAVNGDDDLAKDPLSPVIQNEVLQVIARDALNRVQSEPPNGALTFRYLNVIGDYMGRAFNSRRLGSDFVSSIDVRIDDGADIQEFVKQSVQLSLLTPSKENAHSGPNAPCEGVFHFAFIFAPLFGLLPRRNKAQRLPQILASRGTTNSSSQFLLEI